jgi:hypothetical protein
MAMLLGDLLTRFEDESIAEETLVGLGDLALLADTRRRAADEGLRLGSYAASAVRLYAAHASDEEWLTLMGAMARAADPGAVCLKRALAHSLTGHGCESKPGKPG